MGHFSSMRLVGIVGHGNGTGKTLFLQRLLEAHPARFCAVKFTTVFKDGNCPKDAQRLCACTKLHDEFTILTDEATIAQPDTDTGRLVAAGAGPVIWCLSKPGHHAEAWEHVRPLLPRDRDVVTEGNSALLEIPSDALVFLVNPTVPRKFWKSNWRELAARSCAVVVNDAPEALGRRRPATPEERKAAMVEVQDAAPAAPRIVARLQEPWSEWAGDFLEDVVAGHGVTGRTGA
jgi:hypothetical protein